MKQYKYRFLEGTKRRQDSKGATVEVIEMNSKRLEFGDRVRVVDGSMNIDKNTGEHRHGIDPLFTNWALVVKNNCEMFDVWDAGFAVFVRPLDLLLRFETGEEVYCNSAMVEQCQLELLLSNGASQQQFNHGY